MDIVPRKVIVEVNDKICLIDWGFEGGYPIHFERAGLEVQIRDREFCSAFRREWSLTSRTSMNLRGLVGPYVPVPRCNMTSYMYYSMYPIG